MTKSCLTLNLDNLTEFIRTVEQNPEAGRFTFSTVTEWQGGSTARTRARNFELATDEPEALGGGDSAIDPVELLLASLATCVSIGFATQAAVRGLDFEDLVIETEGEIDIRGYLGLSDDVRKGFTRIRYTARVRADATDKQLEELRRIVERTSPMFDNIINGVPIEGRIVRERERTAQAA